MIWDSVRYNTGAYLRVGAWCAYVVVIWILLQNRIVYNAC